MSLNYKGCLQISDDSMSRRFTKHRKALTFLEILLSALLLATSLATLLASFVSVRRLIERSDRRIAAYNVARSIYDRIYFNVAADTWDQAGNPLTNGVITAGNVVVGPIQYDYSFQSADMAGTLRAVTLTVTFPDSL